MSNSDPSETFTVSPEVREARETVIEAMEHTADMYGLTRSYGRLYGLLFFADEPVSLDTLVEESGYAKSTVSSALSDMEQLHLVYRRSIPGEGKKAFYEAERDFWTVVQEFLRREVQREINTMTTALEDAAETLEAVDDQQATRDLEKIRRMEQMYARSQRVVDLLTSTPTRRLHSFLDRLTGD